jgi:hypothetical protein
MQLIAETSLEEKLKEKVTEDEKYAIYKLGLT